MTALTTPSHLRRGALALVIALAALLLAAKAAAAAAVPGELLVRFAPRADATDRGQLRDQASTTLRSVLPVSGLQLLEVQPGQTVAGAVAALQASRDVQFAEPNLIRRATVTPNDPLFPNLWGLDNTGQTGGTADADIDAPEAWDLDISGQPAPVAVVDSGVAADHADLAPNLWTNPHETANGRDDDGNGYVDDTAGWDWVQADNDPSDANGHGTHVAGTIAANGNDGQGVVGVGWRGSLMRLRVLDDQGNGTVADLVQAYRYAAEQGAKVVNASLGGDTASQSEQAAIAESPGVLFVVAAGNGGSDGVGDDNDQTPEYPCSYSLDNIVCVAATDDNDDLAGFSNFGVTSVDLAAPGVGITSTQPGGAFATMSGTSMATPFVSGVAGLIWARNPGETVTQAKLALLGGVDPKPSLAGRVLTGGRLNAQKTLLAVPALAQGSGQPPPEPAPSPSPSPSTSQPTPRASRPRRVDRSAPRASISISRRARRGRLVVRVSCSERCRFSLRLLMSRGALKRVIAGRGPLVVGRASGRLSRAGSRRVSIRLSRKVARRLSSTRGTRLTLLTKVKDSAGNANTSRRTFSIHR